MTDMQARTTNDSSHSRLAGRKSDRPREASTLRTALARLWAIGGSLLLATIVSAQAAEDVTWQFAYANDGGIKAIANPDGSWIQLRRSVDDHGHVRELERIAGDGERTTHSLDSAGRPLAMTDALGRTVFRQLPPDSGRDKWLL
jgi:YD repeat-containing protein